MQPRRHDYATSGVPCGDGCLLLTDEQRLRKRAAKYRINVGDLQRLIAVTDGLCMLCRRCHAAIVEHCHATHRVRGIVCRWCNHRVSFLEGGVTNRHVVYHRGYSCSCVELGPDRATQIAALELATYRYIDHAMDMAGADPRRAFAALADDPYPG